ncbi:MAG: delta-pyrroline-5-carboxylate dehydrogenase, partial [Chthonomonadales bacterium]|nr:delta-pyrroline-5-carboxylate dehydrogenase [Chthonomonadales bacterium]
MFTPFKNEPYVNFTEEGPRRRMEEALARVGSELGKSYSLVIGGEHIDHPKKT